MEKETKANFTCPKCGFTEEIEMPTISCQYMHKCTSCGETIISKEGDCCVFCSYADKKCPIMQK